MEKLAALGSLAAGIAHEIDNPIGILLSRMELMPMDIRDVGTPGQTAADLGVLHRQATRLGRIAHGLTVLRSATPPRASRLGGCSASRRGPNQMGTLLAPTISTIASGEALKSEDPGSCVLIVDDDADLLETLARLLGRFGHKCLLAASGSEAVDLMDAASPDLVVTDLHMPGMDGVSVVRQARQKTPAIPVILMTAYPMAERRLPAQNMGGVFHLAKPFANADMLDVVERALASSKSRMDHGPAGF